MTDKTRDAFEAWRRERGLGGEDVQWEACQAATQQAAARIAALEAEVLALRKDAERYRFLRYADLNACAAKYWPGGEVPEGDEFDTAIDAAIEAERGEG